MVVTALLDDRMAEVDTGSSRETVSVALVSATVGDTILVHAGEAIARLEPEPPAAMSLYPFLTSTPSDLDRVLAEVRASTVAKAREITELRRTVLERDGDRLVACAEAMAERFAAGGRLLTFGNGGSSTDAQDLARLFVSSPAPEGPRRQIVQAPATSTAPEGPRRQIVQAPATSTAPADAWPAFALTNDIAVVTALTNDIGFDVVFARQIGAFGRPGDVAAGLSTSGNSANLLRGLDEAKRRGLLTIGISGNGGGKMAELSSVDHLFVVPSSSVHRIQEAQTTIYHVLWELTVRALEKG